MIDSEIDLTLIKKHLVDRIAEGYERNPTLQIACANLGIDLNQFKIDHSEEIVFAMLKRMC